MANIDIQNISDLDINGNSLFEDSEGFMTELNDDSEVDVNERATFKLGRENEKPRQIDLCKMKNDMATLTRKLKRRLDDEKFINKWKLKVP